MALKGEFSPECLSHVDHAMDRRVERVPALWFFVRLARVCLLLLALLAIAVNVPHSPLVWIDREFALWLDAHRSETRVALADAIIVVGNQSVIVPLTLVVACAIALLTRSLLRPLAVVGTVAFSGVVSLTMKWLLPSPHPDLNIGSQPALAHMFPSSHTAVVLTLLGATAVAVVMQRTNLWIALTGCAILASLMAFGLAVGHKHWVSDIVGGALLAVAAVAGMRAMMQRSGVGC
jgi:membrane-associated phospholipid phosphatase